MGECTMVGVIDQVERAAGDAGLDTRQAQQPGYDGWVSGEDAILAGIRIRKGEVYLEDPVSDETVVVDSRDLDRLEQVFKDLGAAEDDYTDPLTVVAPYHQRDETEPERRRYPSPDVDRRRERGRFADITVDGETGNETVVYDRDNPQAWIQSSVAIPKRDWL
ncbi:MAG: hypothetical protein ABEI97_01255 [Candidatus Nanohaloarchaea archaeon]